MINFSELYDKHADSLFLFGTKFTSDRELIKDSIQDVFVKLFNKKEELYKVGNLESYIYVALRNRISDEHRRMSRISDDEITDRTMKYSCETDVSQELERREEEHNRNIMMSKYIDQLSPRQQQILHLYYIEERKYNDICRIMGISYQSVRNLMHRSMTKLKEIAAGE